MQALLVRTIWFKLYKGGMKARVLSAGSRGRPVVMAAIRGGPITYVEQMLLPSIREEIMRDLDTEHFKHATKKRRAQGLRRPRLFLALRA